MELGGFFRLIFRDLSGYVCLASIHRLNGKGFNQVFFRYPDQLEEIVNWIQEADTYGTDLYLCPHLLKAAVRTKDNALPSLVFWADLDACHPKNLGKFGEPKPSLVLQTSPGRWQAYWRLEKPVPVSVAEQFNKRIARAYKELGCDQSGWDGTQLLRIPTSNYKYIGT